MDPKSNAAGFDDAPDRTRGDHASEFKPCRFQQLLELFPVAFLVVHGTQHQQVRVEPGVVAFVFSDCGLKQQQEFTIGHGPAKSFQDPQCLLLVSVDGDERSCSEVIMLLELAGLGTSQQKEVLSLGERPEDFFPAPRHIGTGDLLELSLDHTQQGVEKLSSCLGSNRIDFF